MKFANANVRTMCIFCVHSLWSPLVWMPVSRKWKRKIDSKMVKNWACNKPKSQINGNERRRTRGNSKTEQYTWNQFVMLWVAWMAENEWRIDWIEANWNEGKATEKQNKRERKNWHSMDNNKRHSHTHTCTTPFDWFECWMLLTVIIIIPRRGSISVKIEPKNCKLHKQKRSKAEKMDTFPLRQQTVETKKKPF